VPLKESETSCILYSIRYNIRMRTTSYSDLRKNLAATLDSVTDDHAPVLITRDRGKPAAVLMSVEDFASYEETQHLLKSPRNAERLLEAVRELDEGKGEVRELSE
jgi:antitoxin YefM